jgi:hypothetical protein
MIGVFVATRIPGRGGMALSPAGKAATAAAWFVLVDSAPAPADPAFVAGSSWLCDRTFGTGSGCADDAAITARDVGQLAARHQTPKLWALFHGQVGHSTTLPAEVPLRVAMIRVVFHGPRIAPW